MRKQNSDFQTKFISEAGTELWNGDYFAFVELDKYACYVLADSIDVRNESESEAAKMTVNRIIADFTESPSLKKWQMAEYLKNANSELLLNNKRWALKASVMVIVTDYVKLRYAVIGNSRFKLYRNGYVIRESGDQSLSKMMSDDYEITKDKIAKHEERNNLYTYLGQSDAYYNPYISRKIKLMDGDIVSLYTRGIWENIVDTDFDEVFSEAGDDPEKVVQDVEDMLLSSHPEEISCYTLAAIFVNKVFIDPNRKKKIQRILKIVIPLLIITIILIVVIVIWNRSRARQREEMNMMFLTAEEYMLDGNFVKAAEDLKTAEGLAKKLWDKNMQMKISDYMMLAEAINNGNDSLESKDYIEAEELYLAAQKRSRFADNVGSEYIGKRLDRVRGHINVQDHLHIGDTFLEIGDFDGAQDQYEKARTLASSLNDAEGRAQAVDALDALAKAKEELVEEGNEIAKEEVIAADLVIAGDNALKDGDFLAAQTYYTAAKEKYDALENDAMSESVDKKMETTDEKLGEIDGSRELADSYVEDGDLLRADEKYWQAKQRYLLARDIYIKLKDQEKIDEVDSLIEIVNQFIAPLPESSPNSSSESSSSQSTSSESSSSQPSSSSESSVEIRGIYVYSSKNMGSK